MTPRFFQWHFGLQGLFGAGVLYRIVEMETALCQPRSTGLLTESIGSDIHITAIERSSDMSRTVKIQNVLLGRGQPLAVICGPCVIETPEKTHGIAMELKRVCMEMGIPLIFKASFDKANRSSIHAFRGPGIVRGLHILQEIKKDVGLPVLSDVHRVSEVSGAAEILDMIQIPAFLCRQSDLVSEVARTGKPVNIKKGQFLAPWDIANVVEKILASGNENIVITERGTCFGYNNLVVDFRSIAIMQKTGFPVVFDATHSVQLPGAAGSSSGGQREFAPLLAKASVAAGADGVFMEVHPEPETALCDGPNAIRLSDLKGILIVLRKLREAMDETACQREDTVQVFG
jgi:2-dehydro-3-deoxyphosphooctonate aldolase (KDO 8-P synthase)